MFEMLKKLFLGRSSNDLIEPKAESAQKQVRYTMRDGELVETDAVFDAWTSGDIAQMRAALAKKTNLVDRHFLLMSLVDQSYKHRKDDPELGSVRKVRTGRIGAMTGWRPAWQSVTNSRMQLGS